MMINSRKQLIAQITTLDRIVQQRQLQVMEHKEYFTRSRLNHSGLWIAALFVPALCLGWKMSKEKWVSKLSMQLAELMTLAFFTYFRRQLMNLFIIK